MWCIARGFIERHLIESVYLCVDFTSAFMCSHFFCNLHIRKHLYMFSYEFHIFKHLNQKQVLCFLLLNFKFLLRKQQALLGNCLQACSKNLLLSQFKQVISLHQWTDEVGKGWDMKVSFIKTQSSGYEVTVQKIVHVQTTYKQHFSEFKSIIYLFLILS